MFYALIFAGMAVLCVIGFFTVRARNRRTLGAERHQEHLAGQAHRRQRKARNRH